VSGIDRVEWPDEPFYDWAVQSLALLGLAALVLVPVGLLSRALAADLLPGQGALRFAVLAGPALWLLLPVGLLSSLASPSRWQVVSGGVLVRLFRLLPSAVLFYVLSAAVLAAAVGLAGVAILSPHWYILPIAAVLGPALWLIHARLVGQLGWLVHRTEERPAPAAPRKAGARPGKKRPRRRRAEVTDPWAIPEEEDPPRAEALEGYRVVEQSEERRPARPAYLDPEPEPYLVAGAAEPPAPTSARESEVSEAQVERELELRVRRPPNPPPAVPLFSGVWTFPAYPTSRKAMVWLAFWGFFTGAALRFVLLVFPF
jgi:hypothetical protein